MCETCSKIRCSIYGFVSGNKVHFEEYCGEYCEINSGKTVRFINPDNGEVNYSSSPHFGDSFKDLHRFIKTLGMAFYDRLRGINVG